MRYHLEDRLRADVARITSEARTLAEAGDTTGALERLTLESERLSGFPEASQLELEASPLQPILSGVIGTVVTFVLLFLVSRLLLRSDRGSSEECTT